MRFKSRFHLQKREGEERVRTKFLFWPRCLDAKRWRWLEFAEIRERITKQDCGGSGEWGKYCWSWVEIEFVEKDHTHDLRPMST